MNESKRLENFKVPCGCTSRCLDAPLIFDRESTQAQCRFQRPFWVHFQTLRKIRSGRSIFGRLCTLPTRGWSGGRGPTGLHRPKPVASKRLFWLRIESDRDPNLVFWYSFSCVYICGSVSVASRRVPSTAATAAARCHQTVGWTGSPWLPVAPRRYSRMHATDPAVVDVCPPY